MASIAASSAAAVRVRFFVSAVPTPRVATDRARASSIQHSVHLARERANSDDRDDADDALPPRSRRAGQRHVARRRPARRFQRPRDQVRLDRDRSASTEPSASRRPPRALVKDIDISKLTRSRPRFLRPRAVATPAKATKLVAVASAADDKLEKKMPAGFNAALALAVAGSVFATDAVSPELAEAARSSGRMGGSSFRAPSRSAPRGGMGVQSRQAPPVNAMRGGMGYGYGMPMFMPISPFGFGYGFGFGGLGFIFNALLFFWVVNFALSFLTNMTAGNDKRDDDDMGPPRY